MIVFLKRSVLSLFIALILSFACFGQNVQIAFDGLGDGSLIEMKDRYQLLIEPLIEALDISTQQHLTMFDVSLASGYQLTSKELGGDEVHKQHLASLAGTYSGLVVTYSYDRVGATYEVRGTLILPEETSACVATEYLSSSYLATKVGEDRQVLAGNFEIKVDLILRLVIRSICCLEQHGPQMKGPANEQLRSILICEGASQSGVDSITSLLLNNLEYKEMVRLLAEIAVTIVQCNNDGWQPCFGDGIIPHCLWEGEEYPFTPGISGGLFDDVFQIGMADGIYAEGKMLAEFALNIVGHTRTVTGFTRQLIASYTTYYLSCKEYYYNVPTVQLALVECGNEWQDLDPTFHPIYQANLRFDPTIVSAMLQWAHDNGFYVKGLVPLTNGDCQLMDSFRIVANELIHFSTNWDSIHYLLDSIIVPGTSAATASFMLPFATSRAQDPDFIDGRYLAGKYTAQGLILIEGLYKVGGFGVRKMKKWLRKNGDDVRKGVVNAAALSRYKQAEDVLSSIERETGRYMNPGHKARLAKAMELDDGIALYIKNSRGPAVKAWKDAFNLGISKAVRSRPAFLEFFESFRNNPVLRKHVFDGDLRNVTGCHYYGAVDGVNIRFANGVTPEANSLGVIKGAIEMRKPILDAQGNIVDYRWVLKNTGGEPQTFFPSNWSKDEIMAMSSSAFTNPNKRVVPGYTRMFEAESDRGVFIRWFEDASGNASSFFPEF